MNQRLHNLDYLRGMAASGIMIYHFTIWIYGGADASSFLERVGTYGVSIFYVLSGLTLFHVYYDKLDWSGIGDFGRKRFFRIFPLLWLVTIAAIVLSKQTPDFFKLFLNLSGLFGLLKWDAYFSPGVWSIGNELVFYLFFPFFVIFTKKQPVLMGILSAIILGLYIYFAFFFLQTSKSLGEQWTNYIHPFNQVFLFLGGFLLGYFFRKKDLGLPACSSLIFIGLLLSIFYPVNGGVIELVTGVNRFVFTACCFMICLGFYKSQIMLPLAIHKPLSFLGEASYSVYLLHPLVFSIIGIILNRFQKLNGWLHPAVRISLGIALTLLVSSIVYQRFEKYFMRLGRKKQVPNSAS